MPERHRLLFVIGLLLLGIGLVIGLTSFYKDGKGHIVDQDAEQTNIALSSPAFLTNQEIPEKYTCKGDNVSPPLIIAGTPNDAKSLALIMHDPDAVNSDFTHWIAWNLPAGTTSISENTLPPDAQSGSNGKGETGYTGPCPPKGTGTHHYKFEIYALSNSLELSSDTTREQLEKAMQNKVIAQYTLTGLVTAEQ